MSLFTEYGAGPCNATSVLGFDGTSCSPVECGGTLFSMAGVLHPPNWPNQSPGQMFCQWAIVLPEMNRRVQVVIDQIDINSDSRNVCFWNYVIVYNTDTERGLSILPPIFGRYCGRVPPPPITAAGNVIHIWYSIRQPPGGGFSLSFYAT